MSVASSSFIRLKARGQQRTDSTHVLAAIRALNRLECVGETLRAALNTLATIAPEWLREHLMPEWFDRYSTRIEDSRLPKGKEARKDYAEVIGADGSRLLTTLYDPSAPPHLRELAAIQNLRRIWTFHFYAEEGQLRWRKAEDLPPAGMRFDSPYDPDARFGNKRSITWTGFKVHLTETCEDEEIHLITHVETTAAGITDSELSAPIQEALAKKNLLPREHFLDAGYVDADLLVKSQRDLGVEIVGPMRPDSSWQAKMDQGYDNTHFTIDWEAQYMLDSPSGRLGHASDQRQVLANRLPPLSRSFVVYPSGGIAQTCDPACADRSRDVAAGSSPANNPRMEDTI